MPMEQAVLGQVLEGKALEEQVLDTLEGQVLEALEEQALQDQWGWHQGICHSLS